MPARVITNSQNSGSASQQVGGAQKQQIKAPIMNEKKEVFETKTATSAPRLSELYSHDERAKFYTGHDRLNLNSAQIERVRTLQADNDHLQREIIQKEKEVIHCVDPLAILADIEHRQTMVARNTGEILKIYRKSEESVNRVRELEAQNEKLNSEMIIAQGKFISTSDMQLRTRLASEFFILKATIERNLQEIQEQSKN